MHVKALNYIYSEQNVDIEYISILLMALAVCKHTLIPVIPFIQTSTMRREYQLEITLAHILIRKVVKTHSN